MAKTTFTITVSHHGHLTPEQVREGLVKMLQAGQQAESLSSVSVYYLSDALQGSLSNRDV